MATKRLDVLIGEFARANFSDWQRSTSDRRRLASEMHEAIRAEGYLYGPEAQEWCALALESAMCALAVLHGYPPVDSQGA